MSKGVRFANRSGAPFSLKQILVFLSIVFLSLWIRVLFIQSNIDKDWPYSIFYYGDSAHYHEYAVRLLRGELYDNGIPYHPPMYAWFLSAIYRLIGLSGESIFTYKVCMAILNAFTIGLAWLWWRKALGERWSLIATAWLALHFGWLLFSSTFNNEVLYEPFLIGAAALTWLWAESFPWPVAALLGIAMGAGALTRAEHLSLWPFLLIYLYLMRNRELPFRHFILRWSVAVVISFAVILPWSIRNAKVITDFNRTTPGMEPISRFVLITGYGPINFVLANNDRADGGFRPDLINRLGGGGKIDLTNSAHRHYFSHGYSEGLHWIVRNPSRALMLMGAKISRWLDGLSLGLGLSNWPGGLKGSRPPVDMFIPQNHLLKWPLLILLLSGLVLSSFSNYRKYSVCSLIFLHRFIITILFFGYSRGMVVMLPILIPLFLLPFIVIARKFSRVQTAMSAIALILLLWFFGEALNIHSSGPRNYMASGATDSNTGKIVQDDWVQLWPK